MRDFETLLQGTLGGGLGMDGNLAQEAVKQAPPHEAVAQVEPKLSSVPQTPISCHVSPISTVEGLIGLVLMGMLIWHSIAFLMKRRVWRGLVVLCLALAIFLLGVLGILWTIASICEMVLTSPGFNMADFAGGVWVAIYAHWWMFAASVVTIPLGIYWTVLAYANEILTRCSVQDEDDEDLPDEAIAGAAGAAEQE